MTWKPPCRLRLYKEVGGVDWVQFTAPRSVKKVQRARQTVTGPFSIMQGFCIHSSPMTTYWPWASRLPGCHPTHMVVRQRCTTMYEDFMQRGTAATQDFAARHQQNPTSTAGYASGSAGSHSGHSKNNTLPEALARVSACPGTR